MKKERHWFEFTMKGTLLLFFGIMLYALVVAYTRSGGTTGLDMAAIQEMRFESIRKNDSFL